MFIPYDSFSRDFDIDETVQHGKGNWSKKVFENENYLIIIGYLSPNTIFDMHQHDCKETVTVLSGVFFDDMLRIKKVEGETISWEKGVPHKPGTNSLGCMIMVKFEKSVNDT